MIESLYAQLRTSASLVFGVRFSLRALDRLIETLRATYEEYGSLGRDAGMSVTPPELDEETARSVQLRRFRAQARRAAAETPYYRQLFVDLGLDPRRMTFADIQRVPPTTKAALKENVERFVRAAVPVMRISTTGTTGRATGIYFSAYELRVMAALSAIGRLTRGTCTPADVVLSCMSSRAVVTNPTLVQMSAHIGCLLIHTGIVDPDHVLDLLAEERCIPGKKARVSILEGYPSYVGAVVQRGLDRGYGPDDFGLEQIDVGAELVTEGFRRRARQLFGDVAFHEGYAMTEILPVGGTRCEQGHLHYTTNEGLVEVLALHEDRPAEPGEVGRLVVTPFPPFRETTLLLRYDTQDLVRTLVEPPSCTLRTLQATSDLLGKRSLSSQLDAGTWVFPRQVLEALEAVEAVPLPARCGFWLDGAGLTIEVVVRDSSAHTRAALLDALAREGVPVTTLTLCDSREQLQRPLPLRCDLRELTFTPPPGRGQGMAGSEVPQQAQEVPG